MIRFALVACALVACGRPDPAPLATVGLVPEAIDFTVDPCDDFYRFACGTFIAKTVLEPTEYARHLQLAQQKERAEMHLAALVDAMGGGHPAAVFFRTCMDTDTLRAAGAKAVRPLFQVIDGVTDAPSLIAAIAALRRVGVEAPFGVGRHRAAHDPGRWGLSIYPSGLALSAAVYGSNDADDIADVTEYRKHVQALLTMAEVSDPVGDATRTLAVERALAVGWPQDGVGFTQATVPRAELDARAPGLRLGEYSAVLGVGAPDPIEVYWSDALVGISVELASRPIAEWRAYLRTRVMRRFAPALSPAIQEELYRYDGRTLPERRAYCLDTTERMLWQLVGPDFVGRWFPDGDRDAAGGLLQQLTATFDGELAALPWLDDPTRAEARAKLAAIEALIGRPDAWPELGFTIDELAFDKTMVEAMRAWETADLSQIGQPVDRREWLGHSPLEVNAFYVPSYNQVVLPAAILSRPLFLPGGNLAVNLGAIGAVMGHEVTHGFDNGGSLYDADGIERDWWTPEVRDRFDARTACLSTQFSTYQPTARGRVNGFRTLGENIADLGGLKMAVHTLHASRKASGPRDGIGGFSDDQLFFLSYAQSWCAVGSADYDAYVLHVDEHAPRMYRTNGAVRNLPEFAKAFGCGEGATLNPPDRCEVW